MMLEVPISKSGPKRRLIDLGEMSPLRFAQYQQWHDLFISGPTKNVVNTQGNDFPGLYYYDPRTQEEHVLMFEGPINWDSCALMRKVIKLEVEDGKDEYHLVVGLFSSHDLGKAVKLKHWSRKRPFPHKGDTQPRDAMPDQWEALETLISKSFALMPLPKPDKPHDWQHAALTCLGTLKKIKVVQERDGKQVSVFFRTFRSDDSTYAPKYVPESEFQGTAELICQAGLSSALLAYASTNPKFAGEFRVLGLELAKILKHFYDPKTSFLQNTFPPRGEEWERGVIDTWYAFHNLYHVMRVAELTEHIESFKAIKDVALKALERTIIFVKSCNYQIPLFAKIRQSKETSDDADGKVIGFALNPSVLGMYAKCLVFASRIQPEKGENYISEAKTALSYLRRWPIHQLHHQTLQLSWAASAAHELGERSWRDDFTRCLLLNCYRKPEQAGLFQGCAGLSYPSFRETVEAVEPLAEWLDDAPEELHLRQIIQLVLNKAQGFLVNRADILGLPQEGLATLEQPSACDIGVAIYAAPQIFELARLQRQFKI